MGKADVRRLLGLARGGWKVKVCAQETRTWVATSSDRGKLAIPAGRVELPKDVGVIWLRHVREMWYSSNQAPVLDLAPKPLYPGYRSVAICVMDGTFATISMTSGGNGTMAMGSDLLNITNPCFGPCRWENGALSWPRIDFGYPAYANGVSCVERNSAIVQWI